MNSTLRRVILSDQLKNGLVSEWWFQEGTGQTTMDSKGVHTGQLGSTSGEDTNDPTWDSKGLLFGTDDFVTIPHSTNHLSPVFSVGIVITIPAKLGAITRLLIKQNTVNWQGYYLEMQANNTLAFSVRTNIMARTASLLPGSWREGANFFMGVCTGDTAKLFVNGNLVSQILIPSGETFTNTQPLYIGGNAGSQGCTNCTINYVSYYSRALSYVEVKKKYKQIANILSTRGVVLL